MARTKTRNVAKVDGSMEWIVGIFEFGVSFSENKEKCFRSPFFMFSDHVWNLTLESSGWISLHLHDSINSIRNVDFAFRLKYSDCTLVEREFDTVSTSNVLPSVRSKILDPSNLKGLTSLTVICRMENSKRTAETEEFQSSKLQKLEILSSNLKDLFTSKANHDITIKAKEKEFQAHRAVLVARSPVFAAMFEHDLAEKQTGVVDIEDSDPDSFGEFLEYLYTGQLENISFRSAYHLYVTSHKYDVKELKSFCVAYMKRNFTVENFCDVVIMADQYDEKSLVYSAQTFFNRNASNIISTVEWEAMMKKHLHLANSLIKNIISTLTSQTKSDM